MSAASERTVSTTSPRTTDQRTTEKNSIGAYSPDENRAGKNRSGEEALCATCTLALEGQTTTRSAFKSRWWWFEDKRRDGDGVFVFPCSIGQALSAAPPVRFRWRTSKCASALPAQAAPSRSRVSKKCTAFSENYLFALAFLLFDVRPLVFSSGPAFSIFRRVDLMADS